MPDIPTFVKNLLKKTTKTSEQWLEKVPAWLGDHDGVVLTSTWGMINVRTVEGQVLMVYNTVAPAERNLMVEIGRSKDTPNLWQVISRRGVYGNVPGSSSIQYHHIQHEYPAGDSVFVRRDQFTPLLVLPAGDFNVRLYGDVVYKFGMSAPVKVENADLDLSSYSIDAGAKYVLLEAQDDGTLNYIEGSVVGSKELLELEPLPTPSSNAFPICAFIFYEGQTELRRDDEERTIIDLRQFTTDVATDSITQFHAATEKVTIADDDEIFGADSEDGFSATKWLWSTLVNAIVAVTDALYSALGHTHTLFNDSEGDPAPIGTAADGTSAYATRRDHVHAGAREVLTGNRTYYVRTDGSDSNTGLVDSAGGAFLTIQKAVNVIETLDNGGFAITIQVQSGTYTGSVILKGCVGSGALTLQGDTTTPSNVLINPTTPSNGNAIYLGVAAIWNIKGFKITGTNAHSIGAASPQSIINIAGKMEFGAITAGYVHLIAITGGTIQSAPGSSISYTISGGAGYHILASASAIILMNSVTITLTGTPAFTTFAFCNELSDVELVGNTYTGSATGKRYDVSLNGVMNTSGATLPGNAAGTTATGGQYA